MKFIKSFNKLIKELNSRKTGVLIEKNVTENNDKVIDILIKENSDFKIIHQLP